MGVVDQAGLSEEALAAKPRVDYQRFKGPVSGRADTDALESRREGTE
jgi:hypothetical protein